MVTTIVAICGAVFGFAALLLNLSSYLRDRSRLKVTLEWDQRISGDTNGDVKYDPNGLYGIVRVTNIGRRPVFLAEVALVLPSRQEPILGQTFRPPKLSEGDPPAIYMVDPTLTMGQEMNWKRIRAFAKDSTGREYKSEKVNKQPSWGR